jgi:hypothetical protein
MLERESQQCGHRLEYGTTKGVGATRHETACFGDTAISLHAGDGDGDDEGNGQTHIRY